MSNLPDEKNGQGSDNTRTLGDYIVASKGAVNAIVEKQKQAFEKGEKVKRIGELLVEHGIITQEELELSIRNQRIVRLGSCPIFASLSKTELASLSKYFEEFSVSTGEQFIMQGEEDHSLYIIATGKVEVYRVDNEGNEIHIQNVIGPGEPLGEMGYFSGGKRTACVRALEPTQLLRAEYKNLTHYFENVPRVAMAFADVVKYRQMQIDKALGTEVAAQI